MDKEQIERAINAEWKRRGLTDRPVWLLSLDDGEYRIATNTFGPDFIVSKPFDYVPLSDLSELLGFDSITAIHIASPDVQEELDQSGIFIHDSAGNPIKYLSNDNRRTYHVF